jgi:hypothetical protein
VGGPSGELGRVSGVVATGDGGVEAELTEEQELLFSKEKSSCNGTVQTYSKIIICFY